MVREAWLLVLVSYPAIGFAYLWPTSLRDTRQWFVMAAWSAFMIRTFLFHAGLVYALIALSAMFSRRRRLALACLPLLPVCLGPTLLEYLPRKSAPVKGETLTVVTVNLMMVNRNTESMIQEIQAARPDVLLLQEYTDEWHTALRKALGHNLPHCAYDAREDSFGIAIYSKQPFVEPVELSLPLSGMELPQMRAVIPVSGTPVAFYNIHLLPPRTLAYTTSHRLAIADLADLLRAERLPAVVSGDFNFTERTPHYDVLTEVGLRESHRLAGWGRGATWPVIKWFRYLPGLRFDRIFLSSELTAIESHTGIGQGSDHRPVIARIGLRRD